METPQVVLDLVDRFECNRDVYRSNQYNETQARHEFIDPFFKALDWDVNNEKGYAEAYKEVIHEDAIKVGGATKAPDYSFRIGGVRKFFVEAKRPGVNIKEDGDAAYQLRRYAWSAKLALSILTDFEEFAVYDCRVKPDKADKASTARVLYLTLDKYAEKWDKIASIFSPEAIHKGSFDKYIESTKRKKGTAEVDTAFLKEIEAWRDVLARNIALRNTKLSTRELNFAVQRTVDRIIFLRICEDRGIEGYGQLMALQNGTETYKRVCQIFRRADERYNSGLFHFRKDKDRTEPPDGLTLNLAIDDKVLKGILKELYYPESPYEFSVLPADILGHIYEQFLGKVIRLTPAHRAVVEDKPEVKKAGGVYYTPTYIVDYIVEHTVGKLLDGKTPQQVRTLYVLDPACGSGSFLLGAYQRLLDWHLKWYSEHNPEKHARGRKPKIFHGPGGDWRLTTAERKRILLNNIYGVDIDPQAVEVTKLSLLLKVLEGENEETLVKHLRLFHERALPDLADNIKCGNSLIGPDFYEGKQLSLIDEEERYRINAFDWNAEFPEIMNAGGFDAVIGNPPWGAAYSQEEKFYLREYYNEIHIRTPESFNYFITQMWNCAGRYGMVGVIIPSSFLTQHEFEKARKLIATSAKIARVCILGDGVFHKVTAPSCVLILAGQNSLMESLYMDLRRVDRTRLAEALSNESSAKDASALGKDGGSFLLKDPTLVRIVEKCRQFPSLKDVAEDVATGISSGLDKAYVYTDSEVAELGLEKELLRKLILGREVHRYFLEPTSGKRIIYATPTTKIGNYPKCLAALAPYRERLLRRREAANGKIPWYSLNWPRRRKLFEREKILIRQTAERILAAYDPEKWYCLKSVIIVQLDSHADLDYTYLLALLNSKLMDFLYSDLVGEQHRVFPEVKPVQLFKLPIRTIDFSSATDKARHDRMVELVDTMLKLHKNLRAAKTDHEKSLIQRQIDATDKQIDQLVYELYGLTDEEIRIVEEAARDA